VFVGERKKAPPLPEVYRQAIANIPSLNSASPRDGVSFGAQAFLNWADNIENGAYDHIPDAELDGWRLYGEYWCITATNVLCPHVLNRAKELCPDIRELPAVNAVMEKMRAHMNEFSGLDARKLKDRGLMRPVCEMIRKYAGFYNELSAAFG
jgi:hypothetical protein